MALTAAQEAIVRARIGTGGRTCAACGTVTFVDDQTALVSVPFDSTQKYAAVYGIKCSKCAQVAAAGGLQDGE